MTTFDEINRFWLNEVGPDRWWLPQSDGLDQQIRDRFMPAWIDAPRLTADWAASPEGAIAAVVLTDQFPRNMFRRDARAYSTDPLALRLAKAAIDAGFDLATPEPQRQFFYLPFEHSEDPADQDRAVSLFAERMLGENLKHARLHRDAIARFGRFPWRNADLGRTSTAEEQALLDAGGYAALTSGRVTLAEGGGAD